MKNFSLRLILALGVSSCINASEPPVCIIGAGPAGLATAAQLESMGRRTVTFDKKDAVGGKCQAIYQSNGFSPLGALWFSPPTYREFVKIINKSGLTSIPFNLGEKFQYNTTDGSLWPRPAPPPGFNVLFMQEVHRYIKWWTDNFYFFNTAASYRQGLPEDFTVTAAVWLAKHQYKVLQLLFIQTMVAFGYGDYRQVPIIYILQYLTPDMTKTLLKVQQRGEVPLIDFHEVLVRYAQNSISGPMHLSTSITQIDRSGEYPIIKFSTSKESEHQTKAQPCSAVVLAFPPSLPALEAAGLDLTSDERQVFASVVVHSFYTSAVRIKTPNTVVLGPASAHPMLPDEATGDPLIAVKVHKDLDIALTSSWAPIDGNMTSSEVYSRLKTTLSKFNRDPRDKDSVNVPITDDDVLKFQENDYFPHFDEHTLAMGYYQKFNALQGKRNTYYASGFNKFELVEYAIQAGQDIARTYF